MDIYQIIETIISSNPPQSQESQTYSNTPDDETGYSDQADIESWSFNEFQPRL